MLVLRRLSPTAVIALAALFFALGGSAFAVGKAATANQQKCAVGSIRGIAVVLANGSMPNVYQSTASLFARRYNCGGGAIQVKRTTTGEYDVKFNKNAASVALVSVASGASASVTRNADGSFHVTIWSQFDEDHSLVKADTPFHLALI